MRGELAELLTVLGRWDEATAAAQAVVESDRQRLIERLAGAARLAPADGGADIVQRMMEALERLATDRGITQLEVHAAPDAVAFYEKLGWQLIDADRAVPLLAKQIS